MRREFGRGEGDTEVQFQNIGFPKWHSYITWLFSPPRSECAPRSHRVHKWARLRTRRSGASCMSRADRGATRPVRRGVCGANWSRSVSLKNFSAYVVFVALASCLSSNDPNAEARTSRSWDINSSPCVTKLWQTALLDTQRSHKLCQQHIFLQSKHGYKTGSHHSSPAVCGCYSQCDCHL